MFGLSTAIKKWFFYFAGFVAYGCLYATRQCAYAYAWFNRHCINNAKWAVCKCMDTAHWAISGVMMYIFKCTSNLCVLIIQTRDEVIDGQSRGYANAESGRSPTTIAALQFSIGDDRILFVEFPGLPKLPAVGVLDLLQAPATPSPEVLPAERSRYDQWCHDRGGSVPVPIYGKHAAMVEIVYAQLKLQGATTFEDRANATVAAIVSTLSLSSTIPPEQQRGALCEVILKTIKVSRQYAVSDAADA